MIALTLDTSADCYGLAISRDQEILAMECGAASRKLDSEIFPVLERVLAAAGQDVGALDRIIVGRGPGSFVGTRIGMAVANTLATVRGIPAIGVDIFQALAHVGQAEGGHDDCVVAINCVREEVFHRALSRDGSLEANGAIDVLQFPEFVSAFGSRPVVFRATDLNRTLTRDTITAALPRVRVPRFQAILEAMIAVGQAAQATAPQGHILPQPIYVKPGTQRGWQP